MVKTAENLLENDSSKFVEYIEDANKPLYESCQKFTKFSTLVRL